jgi:hypothetical protein
LGASWYLYSADSGQRTADSGQRTADSGQRTADSLVERLLWGYAIDPDNFQIRLPLPVWGTEPVRYSTAPFGNENCVLIDRTDGLINENDTFINENVTCIDPTAILIDQDRTFINENVTCIDKTAILIDKNDTIINENLTLVNGMIVRMDHNSIRVDHTARFMNENGHYNHTHSGPGPVQA